MSRYQFNNENNDDSAYLSCRCIHVSLPRFEEEAIVTINKNARHIIVRRREAAATVRGGAHASCNSRGSSVSRNIIIPFGAVHAIAIFQPSMSASVTGVQYRSMSPSHSNTNSRAASMSRQQHDDDALKTSVEATIILLTRPYYPSAPGDGREEGEGLADLVIRGGDAVNMLADALTPLIQTQPLVIYRYDGRSSAEEDAAAIHDPTTAIGSRIRWTAPPSKGDSVGDGAKHFADQYIESNGGLGDNTVLPFPHCPAGDLLKLHRNVSVMQRLASFGDARILFSVDDVVMGGYPFDEEPDVAADLGISSYFAEEGEEEEERFGNDHNVTRPFLEQTQTRSQSARRLLKGGGANQSIVGATFERGGSESFCGNDTANGTATLAAGQRLPLDEGDARHVLILSDKALYVTKIDGALCCRIVLSSVDRVKFLESARREQLLTLGSSNASALAASVCAIHHKGVGTSDERGGGGDAPLITLLSCGKRKHQHATHNGDDDGHKSLTEVLSRAIIDAIASCIDVRDTVHPQGPLYQHGDASSSHYGAVITTKPIPTRHLEWASSLPRRNDGNNNRREYDNNYNPEASSLISNYCDADGDGDGLEIDTLYAQAVASSPSRRRRRQKQAAASNVTSSAAAAVVSREEFEAMRAAFSTAIQNLRAQINHRDVVLKRLREQHREHFAPHQQYLSYSSPAIGEESTAAGMVHFHGMMVQYVSATEAYIQLLEGRLALSKANAAVGAAVETIDDGGEGEGSWNQRLLKENADLKRQIERLEIEKIATSEATAAVLEEIGDKLRNEGVLLRVLPKKKTVRSADDSDGDDMGDTTSPIISIRDLKNIVRGVLEEQQQGGGGTMMSSASRMKLADANRRLAEALNEVRRRDKLLDEVLAAQQQQKQHHHPAKNRGDRNDGNPNNNAGASEAIFTLLGEQMGVMQEKFERVTENIETAEKRLRALLAAQKAAEKAMTGANERAFKTQSEAMATQAMVDVLDNRCRQLESLVHCPPLMTALATLSQQLASVREQKLVLEAAVEEQKLMAMNVGVERAHSLQKKQQQSPTHEDARRRGGEVRDRTPQMAVANQRPPSSNIASAYSSRNTSVLQHDYQRYPSGREEMAASVTTGGGRGVSVASSQSSSPIAPHGWKSVGPQQHDGRRGYHEDPSSLWSAVTPPPAPPSLSSSKSLLQKSLNYQQSLRSSSSNTSLTKRTSSAAKPQRGWV